MRKEDVIEVMHIEKGADIEEGAVPVTPEIVDITIARKEESKDIPNTWKGGIMEFEFDVEIIARKRKARDEGVTSEKENIEGYRNKEEKPLIEIVEQKENEMEVTEIAKEEEKKCEHGGDKGREKNASTQISSDRHDNSGRPDHNVWVHNGKKSDLINRYNTA